MYANKQQYKRPATPTALLCFAVYLISSQCLVAPVTAQLVPHGSQQVYELSNKVIMTDLQSVHADDISYTFQSALKVNSVWHTANEQLLQIYFTVSMVSAPSKTSGKTISEQITKIPDRPFYVSLIDGKPSKVIAHTSRDQSLLNLERGIASLLQLQRQDGPVTELDVSGQCNSFYAVRSTTRIEKTKTACSHWDLRVNYRAETPLSVRQHSQEKVHFELSADGMLLLAESNELHSIALEAKPDVGSQVQSLLTLKHVAVGEEEVEQMNFATLDEAVQSLLDWYRVFDIEADVDGALSELKGNSLNKQISKLADKLTDEFIGQQELARQLAELLPLARITKEPEFVQILMSHKKLRGQLVDLLGATQTIDAHNAIHEALEYDSKQEADLIERYLQSLAVGTHPERAIIEDLYQRLQSYGTPKSNDKLRDTLVLTVAALTHQSGFDVNDPLLQQVRTYLLSQLEGKCPHVACRTLYIRALQNLQDVSTISQLLQEAQQGEPKVSVAAMQALQSFPVLNYNEQQRKAFADIFYQRQRKFDSSARTIALDILLALRPTKEQLGHLLDYLNSNDRQFEIKTYVVQKLRMLAEKCPRFSSLLTACLAERPEINNYHVIAQKGLTTVLTRELSRLPAYNESLLSVQEIYKGVLKRGSVELILNAGRAETSTFKLGIYTDGLSSFVSDGDNEIDEDEADDSPSTAGMEISVQGVLMRPLVFFTGQTELMGHVWSGTASDPTPAYQATTLVQDHEHYVVLSSGATVYMRVVGMRSVDLNGRVELSIWNRNANTEINQNSGVAVVGHMVAGFTYARVQNDFTVTHEPKLSLQADIDFYSGIKLCMQLQRPDLLLTQTNNKSVQLTASQKSYKKRISHKVTHKSPGRTLALNQKNNDMCKTIFS